eukprot:scaffold2352_cov111-Pinguiococcus_pyrenoidosus.AAC.1
MALFIHPLDVFLSPAGEDSLFNSATEFEWRRALALESRRLDTGSEALEARVPFVACNDHDAMRGVRRGQELQEHFGVEAVSYMYNTVDLSCFFVYASASAALAAPAHVAIEALPTSGRLQQDARNLATLVAHGRVTSPNAL